MIQANPTFRSLLILIFASCPILLIGQWNVPPSKKIFNIEPSTSTQFHPPHDSKYYIDGDMYKDIKTLIVQQFYLDRKEDMLSPEYIDKPRYQNIDKTYNLDQFLADTSIDVHRKIQYCKNHAMENVDTNFLRAISYGHRIISILADNQCNNNDQALGYSILANLYSYKYIVDSTTFYIEKAFNRMGNSVVIDKTCAKVYSLTARSYENISKIDSARYFDSCALAIAKRTIPFGEVELANFYYDYGWTLFQYYPKAESLPLFENALAIVNSNPNADANGLKGNLCINLGLCYSELNDYHKSIIYEQKSVEIFSCLKDSISLAIGLYNLGGVFSNLGQYDSANYYANKSKVIREIKIPNTPYLAETYYLLAYNLYIQMKSDSSIFYYNKAKKIFESQYEVDQKRLAWINYQIAKCYEQKMDYRSSINFYLATLRIRQGIGDTSSGDRYDIYRSVSYCYVKLGDYWDGIWFLDSSINYASKEDSSWIIYYYWNRSVSFSNLGLKKNAMSNMQLSFNYLGKYKAPILPINTSLYKDFYRSYANCFFESNMFDSSLFYYQKSIALNKLSSSLDSSNYTLDIGRIADNFLRLGKYADALVYYIKIPSLIEGRNIDSCFWIYYCHNRGFAYHQVHNLDSTEYCSIQLLEHVNLIKECTGNTYFEIETYFNLALLYYSRQDIEMFSNYAEKFVKKANENTISEGIKQMMIIEKMLQATRLINHNEADSAIELMKSSLVMMADKIFPASIDNSLLKVFSTSVLASAYDKKGELRSADLYWKMIENYLFETPQMCDSLIDHRALTDITFDIIFKGLFDHYYSLGNYELSLKYVDRHLQYRFRSFPFDYATISSLYLSRSYALMSMKRESEGLAAVDSAIEALKKNLSVDLILLSNAFILKADYLNALERYPEAISNYTSAIDYSPLENFELYKLFLKRASCFFKSGDFAKYDSCEKNIVYIMYRSERLTEGTSWNTYREYYCDYLYQLADYAMKNKDKNCFERLLEREKNFAEEESPYFLEFYDPFEHDILRIMYYAQNRQKKKAMALIVQLFKSGFGDYNYLESNGQLAPIQRKKEFKKIIESQRHKWDGQRLPPEPYQPRIHSLVL